MVSTKVQKLQKLSDVNDRQTSFMVQDDFSSGPSGALWTSETLPTKHSTVLKQFQSILLDFSN